MGGKQSKGKERSVVVNIDALDTKFGKKTEKKVFTNDDIVEIPNFISTLLLTCWTFM